MRRKLVRESINEGSGEILKISDLAEIVSRTGNDYDSLLSIFQETFQNEGDEGVIKMFKSATNLNLEEMRHGQYTIKY